MTKEEAIKGLKENLCSLCAYGSQNMDSCDIRGCDNRDYIKTLEQQSDDCVSRQAVFETIDDCNSDGLKGIFCSFDDGERFKEYIKILPPVTPTQCIAAVRFSKEDLKEICNERIEIECTHGTCKDCINYIMGALDEEICLRGHELIHKEFYCADFERRVNENGTDNILSMR